MAQRRFHYDQAFEAYLREHAVPYIAVDEAKRALMAKGRGLPGGSLKNFDFVVYAQTGPNLLVDVKGRKCGGRGGLSGSLDSWVTRADVQSLRQWERIFGHGFAGCFAFLFWCDAQPPDALFLEVFEHAARWYALLGVRLDDYEANMTQRSPRWDTLCMPREAFNRLSVPLREMLE